MEGWKTAAAIGSPIATLIAACVALFIAHWSARRESSGAEVERASESIALLALMQSRFQGTYSRSIPETMPSTPKDRAAARSAISEYNRRWGQSVEEAEARAFTFLRPELYAEFAACYEQATDVLDAMTAVENSLTEPGSAEKYGAARRDLQTAVKAHWIGVDEFRDTIRRRATRTGRKGATLPRPANPRSLTEDSPPLKPAAEPEPPQGE